MIEVIIERWVNPDGTTDFFWSVWRAGSRIEMGGRHRSSEMAEAEATAHCLKSLGVRPDRVTRL